MMEITQNCHCGAPECWPENDYSWLSAAWRGVINDCEASVFFIHGKMIREQRNLPTGTYNLASLSRLLAFWGAGLPEPHLCYSHDTGAGDWGLWIEGVRKPNDEDWARLEAVRQRDREEATRELARIHSRFPALTPTQIGRAHV